MSRKLTTGRVDPLVGYRFIVYIDAIPYGFMSVSGLKEDSETIEYREGHEISTVHKIPGLVSYDDITLERGVSAGGPDDLLAWRRAVVQIQNRSNILSGEGDIGKVYRNVKIDVLGRDGTPTSGVTFLIQNAFPKSLEISDLSADSSDVLVRTMVLAHEGLIILPPSESNAKSDDIR